MSCSEKMIWLKTGSGKTNKQKQPVSMHMLNMLSLEIKIAV